MFLAFKTYFPACALFWVKKKKKETLEFLEFSTKLQTSNHIALKPEMSLSQHFAVDVAAASLT